MASAPPPRKASGQQPAASAQPKPSPRAAGQQQAMQQKANSASGEGGEGEEEEYEDEGGMNGILKLLPSWIFSGVFHMIFLIILALITISTKVDGDATIASAMEEEETEELDELIEEELDDVPVNIEEAEFTDEVQPDTNNIEDEVRPDPIDDDAAAPVSVELVELSDRAAPAADLLNTIGAFKGNATSGRGDPARRSAMVQAGGGNGKSEAAVGLALKWLANHQLADGSWSFDHRKSACQGRCANHGSNSGPNGATAMGLLPFLGAGNTHLKGKYKDNVRRALTFLGKSMKAGGSLHEGGGNMYSHGLASIALCEAYAMTRDKKLQPAAQMTIDFISEAQDPAGGGWRYSPKQKGDTSVVGWQIMALKSGHMSYLNINPLTIKNASKFLDSVQTDSGAFYGYAGPGKGNATTAIGLLCRMYLGWKRDNGAIQRGAQFLSDTGPSAGNMYYNYYATQVMRHYDGDLWTKWNAKMRPQLVNSQSKNGHETGSWFMKGGGHGSGHGGRLYCTSMAAMILEVYYRHLPIYQSQASEDDFPD